MTKFRVQFLGAIIRYARRKQLASTTSSSEFLPTYEEAKNYFWREKPFPQRWTGQNLLLDAKVVDNILDKKVIHALGMSLSDFYEIYMPETNWNLHGSSLAAVRRLSLEDFDCSLSTNLNRGLSLCALATEVMLLYLQERGLNEDSNDLLVRKPYNL